MRDTEGARRVVVVGAGAAGSLVATHLLTSLSSRFTVTLVDPAPSTGRGTAYSTTDPRHLLNVPASGMSAFPRDPDHFVRWLRNHHDPDFQPHGFAPRGVYGDYISGLLTTAAEFPGNARLDRRTASVVDVRRAAHRLVVDTADGASIPAAAVVLAIGTRPTTTWAPAALAADPRLVADPWTQLVPEGDVLLLGAGLTMIDVAISHAQPGRTLHVVSRTDEVPRGHVLPTTPPVPPPPGITRAQGLADLRARLVDHVEETLESTGDWRPAIDGLRAVTAQLWQGLDEADKREFLAEDARAWDVRRHRMAPETLARWEQVLDGGDVQRHRGTIASVEPGPDVLRVTLSNGEVLEVGSVVNCTGPVGTIAADPLLARLATTGVVRPGPAGMGVDTAEDGRVEGTLPRTLPLLTLGALRRGNLWETTAMPEIREQAYDVARSVARALHGETRRRPTDTHGLTLTTTREAARHYNAGLGRLLRLQDGVEERLEKAVAADADFVQGHAALALLGHEWGADTDWRGHLRAAHDAATRRHLDDREAGFLDAVTTRLRMDEATGTAALLRHIRMFPRDALAVSVAVPTVAFGGLTSGSQTSDLVEWLGRSYGDDWWYAGQLAFVRQDQERWSEAEDLASYALSVEPSSGHAVHARAHVHYETGQHTEGLAWLDEWIRTHGRRSASHLSHFSWHAALHELQLDDVGAVRLRYERELAHATGARAVVDTASLLWRTRVTDMWDGPQPVMEVFAAAPQDWLTTPPTSFATLHTALLLATCNDAAGLAALRDTTAASADPTDRDILSPLADGLLRSVEGDWPGAARRLERLLGRLDPIGGSKAQREVVEDTVIHALAQAGRADDAAQLLDVRLSRRPSALDARRQARLVRARQAARR